MNYLQTAISSHQDLRFHDDKRNAYHQAGYAAAIYFGNKQKKLPAVHFQIEIQRQGESGPQKDRFTPFQDKYAAKVEGGRLIPKFAIGVC